MQTRFTLGLQEQYSELGREEAAVCTDDVYQHLLFCDEWLPSMLALVPCNRQQQQCKHALENWLRFPAYVHDAQMLCYVMTSQTNIDWKLTGAVSLRTRCYSR